MLNADISLSLSPGAIHPGPYYRGHLLCDLRHTISIVGPKKMRFQGSQLIFPFCSAFAAGCRSCNRKRKLSFPTDKMFWHGSLFRRVYQGRFAAFIRVSCQKHVKPVNASLIFHLKYHYHIDHQSVSFGNWCIRNIRRHIYQIIGCILLSFLCWWSMIPWWAISAIPIWKQRRILTKRCRKTQSTVSRKLTNMTLIISMTALVISTMICIRLHYKYQKYGSW